MSIKSENCSDAVSISDDLKTGYPCGIGHPSLKWHEMNMDATDDQSMDYKNQDGRVSVLNEDCIPFFFALKG